MPTRLPSVTSYLGDPRYWMTSGGKAPNVLEIPSIYNTPSRTQIFDAATGTPSYSYDCDCTPRQQGGAPRQPQNPYQLPGPQGLGQPPAPQKPFQPIEQQANPCFPTQEALRGMGVDPDCLRRMSTPARKKPRKKAKAATMPRSGKKRSKAKKKVTSRATAGAKGYRTLKNGTCYDVSAKKFVAKRYCS